MAEALGIVAASIQLLEVAIKSISAIYDFSLNIANGPANLKLLQLDLQQTRDLLNGVLEFHENPELHSPACASLLPTLKLLGNSVTKFLDDLELIENEVRERASKSKRWREKFRSGMRGETEYNQMRERIKYHVQILGSTFGLLSNEFHLLNNRSVTTGLAQLSTSINQKISVPLTIMQRNFRDSQNSNTVNFSSLKDTMSLQQVQLEGLLRSQELGFQWVTEIQETHQDQNAENSRSLSETNDMLIEKFDKLTLEIQDMANGLHTKDTDIEAQIRDLKFKVENSPRGQNGPSDTRAKQKSLIRSRRLDASIKRIQQLADDPNPSKIIRSSEAMAYIADLQDIVDALLDNIQEEPEESQPTIPEAAEDIDSTRSQLLALSSPSIFVQKEPDSKGLKKFATAHLTRDNILNGYSHQAISHRELQANVSVRHGQISLSATTEERKQAGTDGEDSDAIAVSRTQIHFIPKIRNGDPKSIAFKLALCKISGDMAGTFSVPPLLRVYNRIYFDELATEDANNPFSLAKSADLDRFKLAIREGRASVYDCDQFGRTYLHVRHICFALTTYSWTQADSSQVALTAYFSCPSLQGHPAMIDFLLNQGADPNAMTDDGSMSLLGRVFVYLISSLNTPKHGETELRKISDVTCSRKLRSDKNKEVPSIFRNLLAAMFNNKDMLFEPQDVINIFDFLRFLRNSPGSDIMRECQESFLTKVVEEFEFESGGYEEADPRETESLALTQRNFKGLPMMKLMALYGCHPDTRTAHYLKNAQSVSVALKSLTSRLRSCESQENSSHDAFEKMIEHDLEMLQIPNPKFHPKIDSEDCDCLPEEDVTICSYIQMANAYGLSHLWFELWENCHCSYPYYCKMEADRIQSLEYYPGRSISFDISKGGHMTGFSISLG
ncbi:hypothetical protein ABW19_dt0205828 [Dactylella cylindrospora]|nr:hypothetical protein ABW19_dt0205828 [Dactylella cylindrospora]